MFDFCSSHCCGAFQLRCDLIGSSDFDCDVQLDSSGRAKPPRCLVLSAEVDDFHLSVPQFGTGLEFNEPQPDASADFLLAASLSLRQLTILFDSAEFQLSLDIHELPPASLAF